MIKREWRVELTEKWFIRKICICSRFPAYSRQWAASNKLENIWIFCILKNLAGISKIRFHVPQKNGNRFYFQQTHYLPYLQKRNIRHTKNKTRTIKRNAVRIDKNRSNRSNHPSITFANLRFFSFVGTASFQFGHASVPRIVVGRVFGHVRLFSAHTQRSTATAFLKTFPEKKS